LLTQALTLCQMDRAAILLGSELSSLKLHSSVGVSKTAREATFFFGSLGALQTAISGETLIVNDISQHQALSQRASIQLKTLSALACIPLICQGQILGLFYIDCQQPSKFLSSLDVELLQTLVESISLHLLSQQIDQQLQYISVNSRQLS
jgi:GAF domain-containing protein